MATSQQLDFTNVKEGGNFNKKHYSEGDYLGKVLKVQDAVKKGSKEKMWLFTIQVKTGTYPYYCQFAENTLWKIRNLFVAAGINVPKKRVKVDPAKVVGRPIGVTLQDTEYDGKIQSEIGAVFPPSELEGQEEEADDDETDEEPEAKPQGKKAKTKGKDQGKTPGGKKKKAKLADDVSDDELEELDIDEI